MITHKNYRSLMDQLIATTRKAVPTKEVKKMTDPKLLEFVMSRYNPNWIRTFDFNIFAKEFFWKRSGKPMIIIESNRICEKLLNSDFTFSGDANLNLPEVFSISVPEDLTWEGITIPPFLCTWIPNGYSGDIYYKDFCKLFESSKDINHIYYDESVPVGEPILKITCRNTLIEEDSDAMLTLAVPQSRISKVLKEKSLESLGMLTPLDDSKFYQSSADEIQLQYFLVRLVASLAVFNQASAFKYVESGLPKNLSFESGDKISKKTTFFVKDPGSRKQVNPSEKDWHFRRFYHDKYYKGEYANWARGTRWTLVNAPDLDKVATITGKKVGTISPQIKAMFNIQEVANV